MERDLKGLETHDRLREAFGREAAICSRYLYFAKIAEIEGAPETAKLFRELAESSACNSHGHLDFLRLAGDPDTGLPIGETDRNLLSAISAETHEYSELYPQMQETARQEGLFDIDNWLQTLAKLKRVHVEKMQHALAQFNDLHEK